MPPASTDGLDQIEIDIAPGSGPGTPPALLIWEPAGSRRTASDIGISVGRDDEASTVEAGSMTALMDDREGDLSPRNAAGQWFGSLRRGTPAQVRWDRTTDDFTRTAVAGGWGTNADGFAWYTSNAAYMSTDGTRAVSTLPTASASNSVLTDAGSIDAEVAWSFTCPVMPTGGNATVGAVLRYADSSNVLRPIIELTPAGDMQVNIIKTIGGSSSFLTVTAVVTTGVTAGTKIWGKARAEGATILIKAWLGNRGDEPAGWNAVGTDAGVGGSGVGVFLWKQNTNAGTYTVYVDDFEVRNILWVGSIPEWSPRWPDKSGADVVAPITGAGILRQLSRDTGIVQSPLRRQLGGLDYAVAYLPLEDASDATSPGSGISWGRRGRVHDVSFAGDDTLPGSDATLVLNTAGVSYAVTEGVYPSDRYNRLAADGFAAMVLFRCESAVAAERVLLDVRTIGTVDRWEVYVNGSSYGFRGYNDSGALLTSGVATYGGVVPTEWVAIQLEAVASGGTVSATLIWHQVDDTTFFSASDSHSGSCRYVTGISVRAVQDGMSAAHLWAGDHVLPFVTNSFAEVANGYIGEPASERIARLCSEAFVPVAVMDGDSEPMGPQKPAKLLDLLRQCEAADLGVLYERGTSLGYRPRARRYRPDVSLALDWAAGHLDEPPEPQDDDQRLANYVTVNRPSGSYAVASDQDSIDEIGPYPLDHEANIATDDRLDDFATWLLSQGTDDQLRWPRIKINLVAHPELIPAWLACTIGSRVTIDNVPIPGVVVDLVIEGYTQTINVNAWTVEMSCSPSSAWFVGRYDDPEQISKYQLRSGTIGVQYGSAATSITVLTTDDGETLSQTSAYDIMVAGERIGVPIGGAAARTGSTGAWSTVLTGLTRGKNGVNKVLPEGSTVKIADAARYGL